MTADVRGRVRPPLAFVTPPWLVVSCLAALAGLGTPDTAFAHATVSPTEAKAGSYLTTTIQIPHGCEGSATTAVRVVVPEGYIGVKPQPKPGWQVTTRKAAYARTYQNHGRAVGEGIVEVTWSGGPLPDDQFDEFKLTGFVAAEAPQGADLSFATTQTCEKGQIAWDQRAAEGQDPHQLKTPAPLMRLTSAKPSSHHAGANASHDLSAAAKQAVTLGDLTIAAPWARATPAGAKVGGGYLTITNNGKEPDRLVSATTSVADHVEIHEMAVVDGVMRMRPLGAGLEIKPGETVTLKPGSFHLMFMGLKDRLEEGQTITLKVTFEKAGATELKLDVRGLAAMKGDASMNHGGHSR